MGFWSWFKNIGEEKFREQTNLYKSISHFNKLLAGYCPLLVPLLGVEETIIRLMRRLVNELKEEGIELTDKSINTISQGIYESSKSSTYLLGTRFVGAWVAPQHVASRIEDHVVLLQNFIKDEMNYPLENRLLRKEELLELIKMVYDLAAEFDKFLEYREREAKKSREEEKKWENSTIMGKLTAKITRLSEKERIEIRKEWEEIQNFRKKLKKILDDLIEYIKKEY